MFTKIQITFFCAVFYCLVKAGNSELFEPNRNLDNELTKTSMTSKNEDDDKFLVPPVKSLFTWTTGPVSGGVDCFRYCIGHRPWYTRHGQCIVSGFRVQRNHCMCYCLPIY